ncbi:uncharacterized protein LOC134848703 [Symsagittifera roscoffensis]|uniref:uncharacterized protein LOC134848703 n=1 Tax=Symsagittifera roscoffensis TaxID=84072 RepID=UPI00307B1838
MSHKILEPHNGSTGTRTTKYGRVEPQQPYLPNYDDAIRGGARATREENIEAAHHINRPADSQCEISKCLDVSLRHGFISKVYGILSFQLLVTFGIVSVFVFVKPVKDFINSDPEANPNRRYFMLGIACAVFLAVVVVIYFCKTARRRVPYNYIFLAILSIASGCMVGVVASIVGEVVVAEATACLVVICFCMTLFGCQTKIALGPVFIVVFSLCMAILSLAIMSIWTYNNILPTVFASIGVAAVSLILLASTWLILNWSRHHVMMEEYVFCALMLYIDIVFLFIFLLLLLKSDRNFAFNWIIHLRFILLRMSLKIQKEREPSMAQLEQRETTIGFVDPQQSSPPNYDDATKDDAAAEPRGDLEVDYYPNNYADTHCKISQCTDAALRQGFICKVYAILSFQLLVTFGIVALFAFVRPVREFINGDSDSSSNWPLIMLGVAFGVFIVVYIVIICSKTVRRRVPYNYIFLTIFSVATGYMLGILASVMNQVAVAESMACLALICFCMTLFGCQTKIALGPIFIVLFTLSVAALSLAIMSIWTYNNMMPSVYAALIVALFSLILLVDTWLIINSGHHDVMMEEYVFCALMLYVDIIYIFLYLLMLLGGSSRN